MSFLRWLYKSPVRSTKHAASKKNHVHKHNLSKGQMKDVLRGKKY